MFLGIYCPINIFRFTVVLVIPYYYVQAIHIIYMLKFVIFINFLFGPNELLRPTLFGIKNNGYAQAIRMWSAMTLNYSGGQWSDNWSGSASNLVGVCLSNDLSN